MPNINIIFWHNLYKKSRLCQFIIWKIVFFQRKILFHSVICGNYVRSFVELIIEFSWTLYLRTWLYLWKLCFRGVKSLCLSLIGLLSVRWKSVTCLQNSRGTTDLQRSHIRGIALDGLIENAFRPFHEKQSSECNLHIISMVANHALSQNIIVMG